MMAVLAGVAVVSSCSDDDDDPRIETDKTSAGLTFAADATTAQIINVTSDVTGTVTAQAKDNWATPVVNGKAISVTVSANTGAERTTNITVGANGFRSVDVKVTQAAGGSSALLSVSPSPYAFPAAGEEKAFTVTTELEGWVATVAGTGFTKESETATTVVVKATENTGAARTGTITFTHADLSAPVVVNLTQAAAVNATPYNTISVARVREATGEFYFEFTNGTSGVMFNGIANPASASAFELPTGTWTMGTGSKNFKKGSVTWEEGYSGTYHFISQSSDGILFSEASLANGGTIEISKSGNTYTIVTDLTATGVTNNNGTLEETTPPFPELRFSFTGTIEWTAISQATRPMPPAGSVTFDDLGDFTYNVTATPNGMGGGGPNTWDGAVYKQDDSSGKYWAFSNWGVRPGGNYIGFYLDFFEDLGNVSIDCWTKLGSSSDGVDAYFGAVVNNDGWKLVNVASEAFVPTIDKTAKTVTFSQKTEQDNFDMYFVVLGYKNGTQTSVFSDAYADAVFTLTDTPSPTTRTNFVENKDYATKFSGTAVKLSAGDIVGTYASVR